MMKYLIILLACLVAHTSYAQEANQANSAELQAIMGLNERLNNIDGQLSRLESQLDNLQESVNHLTKIGSWFAQPGPPTTSASTPSSSYSSSPAAASDNSPFIIHEAP